MERIYQYKQSRAAPEIETQQGMRVLRNVSMCSVGEAIGHGTWSDELFIESIVDAVNKSKMGIKARFGHPGICEKDALGSEIGTFRNARLMYNASLSEAQGFDVWQCVADLHECATTELNRALKDHVFALAEKEHNVFGTSIVFRSAGYRPADPEEDPVPMSEVYDEWGYKLEEGWQKLYRDNPHGYPHDTLHDLMACDFVSDPACNPGGLYAERHKMLDMLQKYPDLREAARAIAFGQPLQNRRRESVERFYSENDIDVTKAKIYFSILEMTETQKKGAPQTRSAVPNPKPPPKKVRSSAPPKVGYQSPTPAPAPAPAPPKNPKFRSPAFKPLAKVLNFFGIKQTVEYGDWMLTDGNILRTPSEELLVGDPCTLVAADGTEIGTPDDGEWPLEDGRSVIIIDGIIKEVRETEMDAEPDPSGEGEIVSASSALLAKLNQLEKQLEEMRNTPAPFVQNRSKGFRPQQIHRNGNVSHQDIADSIKVLSNIAHAQRTGIPCADEFRAPPGYVPTTPIGSMQRFSPISRRDIGTGVDFGDMLIRCEEWIKELYLQQVIVEGINDRYMVKLIDIGGNATQTTNLTSVRDSPTVGDGSGGYERARYIKEGQGCDLPPAGENLFGKRQVVCRPWHAFRKYCPTEWGDFMDGKVYVNAQELPFQAVILRLFFDNVIQEWEGLLLTGYMPGGDLIDGFLTIMNSDPDIPTNQIVLNYDITPSTAVTEFERLAIQTNKSLWGRRDVNFSWLMPTIDPDLYRLNYRSVFPGLPYNTSFEKMWIDMQRIKGEFVPTIHMPLNRHILTPKDNLRVHIGRQPEIETGYDPMTKYLWVRIEGHVGVNYALSEEVSFTQPI